MANSQPISDPVGSTRLSATDGVDALDHCRGVGALSSPSTGATAGTRSGVYPGGTSGSGPSDDLKGVWVSGRTIRFNAGHFGVDRGGGRFYTGFVYSAVDVTLDAGDTTNPRYDYVVLRQRDPAGISGDSAATETAKIIPLKGTPAASPTEPTSQLTSGDILLGCYLVGAGSSATLSAAGVESGDRRKFIAARGGTVPHRDGDGTIGAYEGELFWNIDTDELEVWNGTALAPLASPAEWSGYSPNLYAAGSSGPPGSAIVCDLGNGATKIGRYKKIGKRLDLSITWTWGAAPFNMGVGAIFAYLPSGLLSRKGAESHLYAKLYTPNGINLVGDCYIPANSALLIPGFPATRLDGTIGYYVVAKTAGKAGESWPQPDDKTKFPEGGVLTINGTLEIQ